MKPCPYCDGVGEYEIGEEHGGGSRMEICHVCDGNKMVPDGLRGYEYSGFIEYISRIVTLRPVWEIECQKCRTLNSRKANHCKRCGTYLQG
jgi:hypothetical protein